MIFMTSAHHNLPTRAWSAAVSPNMYTSCQMIPAPCACVRKWKCGVIVQRDASTRTLKRRSACARSSGLTFTASYSPPVRETLHVGSLLSSQSTTPCFATRLGKHCSPVCAFVYSPVAAAFCNNSRLVCRRKLSHVGNSQVDQTLH